MSCVNRESTRPFSRCCLVHYSSLRRERPYRVMWRGLNTHLSPHASSSPSKHTQDTRAMPRPIHPLTPASSTDIPSRGDKPLSPHLAFVLPPPAVQASEVVKARRRSSAREENGPAFALPPPPTRSRKIIQVKPKPDGDAEPAEKPAKAPAGGKKKAPSATSAAGRKMARKTAHSLIERRRRLKMNEEFNCLKGLIPACTGEMHKLAILQVSSTKITYRPRLMDRLPSSIPDTCKTASRSSRRETRKTTALRRYRPSARRSSETRMRRGMWTWTRQPCRRPTPRSRTGQPSRLYPPPSSRETDGADSSRFRPCRRWTSGGIAMPRRPARVRRSAPRDSTGTMAAGLP